MKVLYDAIALLLSATFFYTTDKNRCGKGNGLIFLHHIISNFVTFAWLSYNQYTLLLFLFVSVLIFISWIFNGGKCKITNITNKLCAKPENALFYDFWDLIGIKRYKLWRNIGLPLYSALTWAVALYKLLNRKALKLGSRIL